MFWYDQLPKWFRFTVFCGTWILWAPLMIVVAIVAYPFWAIGNAILHAWRTFDDE